MTATDKETPMRSTHDVESDGADGEDSDDKGKVGNKRL